MVLLAIVNNIFFRIYIPCSSLSPITGLAGVNGKKFGDYGLCKRSSLSLGPLDAHFIAYEIKPRSCSYMFPPFFSLLVYFVLLLSVTYLVGMIHGFVKVEPSLLVLTLDRLISW